MPLLMANAHVHTLLVEELALLWNQKNVTHKFTHCKNQTQTRKLSAPYTNYKYITAPSGGEKKEWIDELTK